MKLTNRLNLPTPILRMAERADADYSRGGAEISVTQIIAPPRQIELIRRHEDDLSEDVSMKMRAMQGTLVHDGLEREVEDDALAEQRLYMDVLGWRISGKFDYYKNGLLQDYKTATVSEWIYGIKKEREEQLNVLAHLCRANNIPVDAVEAVFWWLDWSPRGQKRHSDYPEAPITRHELPLWQDAYAQAYLEHRVGLHQMARNYLPECDAEERWQRPTKHAVMKRGNKRALRVFDSDQEAIDYRIAEQHKHMQQLYVEHRPGESIRCEMYCLASSVCEQWQAMNADADG